MLHDMTLRLDGLYDIIVELEEKIEGVKLRRKAVEQDAITLYCIRFFLQRKNQEFSRTAADIQRYFFIHTLLLVFIKNMFL